MVVGIALAHAIKKTTGVMPGIKWPNDLLTGGKKIAGILTEMNSEMDKINYIITGIGINVNNQADSLPEDIKPIATSLREICRKDISIINLVRNLLEEFDYWYSTFIGKGFAPISAEWKKLNVTLGNRVKVYDGEIEIFGKAMNIDEEGFLIVLSDTGQSIRILSGDVSLRNQ